MWYKLTPKDSQALCNFQSSWAVNQFWQQVISEERSKNNYMKPSPFINKVHLTGWHDNLCACVWMLMSTRSAVKLPHWCRRILLSPFCHRDTPDISNIHVILSPLWKSDWWQMDMDMSVKSAWKYILNIFLNITHTIITDFSPFFQS